jgi:5-methyltetrahydrofolate--homocysteine methyltransferase
LDYSSKENIKFNNIYNISLIIKDILEKYKDNEIDIYMEGVSYGSVGSAALVDLSFLNASIRMILKELEINFNIISPTQVKKFACANGQAEKDIIIDPLALTISTDKNSALVTLEVVERLKKMGKITSLGVSNISFGLPSRDIINSTFFALALEKGLSAAIMNPFSDRMMEVYHSFIALHGFDENFENYINNFNITANTETKSNIIDDTLENAIKNGLSEKAAKLTFELLKSNDQLKIVNEMIIPALDEVGKGFEEKTIFLPRLLMSAEAAKSAFEEIKRSMNDSMNQNGEKIIIATVKGDIHDIGKNIVKSLLMNYGFEIIDLGKDVPPENIYNTVIEHNAKLVCLSALMTTTVGAMEETIQMLKGVDCKVMVGGAVVTSEYAESIGADFYAKDAMEAVRIAEELFLQR